VHSNCAKDPAIHIRSEVARLRHEPSCDGRCDWCGDASRPSRRSEHLYADIPPHLPWSHSKPCPSITMVQNVHRQCFYHAVATIRYMPPAEKRISSTGSRYHEGAISIVSLPVDIACSCLLLLAWTGTLPSTVCYLCTGKRGRDSADWGGEKAVSV
jgi:hypothetical protein